MFRQATRKQTPVRAAIYGVAGTDTMPAALVLARGIAGKDGGVCVLDTSGGESELFADRFPFLVSICSDVSYAGVTKALQAVEIGERDVLVISDGTAPWRHLMDVVDRAKTRGDSNAWAAANPAHKEWIDAVRSFRRNVVVVFRGEVTSVVDSDNGHSRLQRIPTRPEQGKGIENEFPVLLRVEYGGEELVVEKDPRDGYKVEGTQQGLTIWNLQEWGAALGVWAATGELPPTEEQGVQIRNLCLALQLKKPSAYFDLLQVQAPSSAAEAADHIQRLQKRVDDAKPKPTPEPPRPTSGAPSATTTPTTENLAPSPPLAASGSSAEVSSTTTSTPSPSTTSSQTSGAATEGPVRPVPTEVLVAFRAACMAVNDAQGLANTIADWSKRLDELPKRQRSSADRYASARLAQINGDELSEDQKASVNTMEKMAQKAGAPS